MIFLFMALFTLCMVTCCIGTNIEWVEIEKRDAWVNMGKESVDVKISKC